MVRNGSRKKRLAKLLLIPVFLGGLLLVLYPFVSNYLYEQDRADVVARYEDFSNSLDEQQTSALLDEAHQYNQLLSTMDLSRFSEEAVGATDEETTLLNRYDELLSASKDAVIATVEIPKIDVSLPVYHGTSTKALTEGIGHIRGSSLPIGGKGSHTLLTGHTGLSSQRILSDIDRLENGDVFYLHTVDDKLAYRVDDKLVIEPDDFSHFAIDPDQDCVTLITCTPYGINTHRLIVHASRIELPEEQPCEEESELLPLDGRWFNEYLSALLVAVAALLILAPILILAGWLHRRRHRTKRKPNE